jgi:hypothetical protein
MTDELLRYDRAAIVLGIGSLIASLLVFGTGTPTAINFIHVGVGGAIGFAVFGVVGILGGVMRRASLTMLAGGGLTLLALVQLATLPLSSRPLGGDASAMALLGALGIGLLLIGIARRGALADLDRTIHTNRKAEP